MTAPQPCPHCPTDDPDRTPFVPEGHADRTWESQTLRHLHLRHRAVWQTLMADMASRHAASTRDPIAVRIERRMEAGL